MSSTMSETQTMPDAYVDLVTGKRLQATTYLHGGGVGEAGLQITLADRLTQRAVCVRLPGPAAAEWLAQAATGLVAAREQARLEPWGAPETVQPFDTEELDELGVAR